jgi:SMI1 / KNR4 family (SUKH-1)
MHEDRVERALSEVRSRKPFVPEYSTLDPPSIIQCEAQPPVQWESAAIEAALRIRLPEELVALWNKASQIRLYDDVNYGQWGCILWSPSEVIDRHRYSYGWRGPGEFRPGDLIIGEFRGDTDMVVLRCDPSQQDFGSVVIALGNDPRDEWPHVAASIAEFMTAYLSHPDKKFWEAVG